MPYGSSRILTGSHNDLPRLINKILLSTRALLRTHRVGNGEVPANDRSHETGSCAEQLN